MSVNPEMVLIGGTENIPKFYVGMYPVTAEEYSYFCQATDMSVPTGKKGKHPVVNVSWEDALAYCGWLSEETGKQYRLLTEEEWEYACRAGSQADYCFGDDVERLDDYAWYSSNSGGHTHPVGEKLPNVWGLYDMHGNVWEWTSTYDEGRRVVCGGGWPSVAWSCSSAFRISFSSDFLDTHLGFRLACDVTPKTATIPTDPVKKPSHYQFYDPCNEVRDVIRDRASKAVLNDWPASSLYDYLNAIKYVLRAPSKNGKEDIEKAIYCLQSLLEIL